MSSAADAAVDLRLDNSVALHGAPEVRTLQPHEALLPVVVALGSSAHPLGSCHARHHGAQR